MPKNWMKKAVRHPGALRVKAEKAGAIDKKTGKIEKSFIDKAAKSKNPTTRKQANLAKTFTKYRRG